MANDLFSGGADWHNNACINFIPDSTVLYIAGYKEAADTLVNTVRKSAVDQDILVYPIAFLYRQYIELQLKRIIGASRILLKDGSDFPAHHKIKALWDVAHGLMKKIIDRIDKSPGEYITKDDIKIIGRIVNDFVEVDPGSFSFRYPEDKDGNKNLKGLTHINLRKLGEQMNLLAEKLGKFDLVVGLLNEQREEMIKNMRVYVDDDMGDGYYL